MVRHQFRRFPPFQDNQEVQVHDLLTNQASVPEQDTVPLAALHASPPAVPHKVAANLSTALHPKIRTGLARLQDPQPEGLSSRGLKTVKAGTNLLGMFPILTLTNAFGLLIVSFSYYLSILTFGNGALELFFLLGLLFIFVPNLARLLSPAPSRVERICLLCGLRMYLYLVRFITSPLRFAEYDEFLNWRTADDILRTGHLFSENSMLPDRPLLPWTPDCDQCRKYHKPTGYFPCCNYRHKRCTLINDAVAFLALRAINQFKSHGRNRDDHLHGQSAFSFFRLNI